MLRRWSHRLLRFFTRNSARESAQPGKPLSQPASNVTSDAKSDASSDATSDTKSGWIAALASLDRRYLGQSLSVEALSDLAHAMTERPAADEEEAARWFDERMRRPMVSIALEPPAADDGDRALAQRCHHAIAEELQRAAQETETEVLGAGAKLGGIYRETSAHAAGLKTMHAQFVDRSNSGGETLGRVIAGQATALSAFPEAFDSICERLDAHRALATGAGVHTAQILTLAGAIDKITATINILGINALITAVQAGEHGAAFSVVANELRTLSAKTKAANESIASLARELSQTLPKLSENGEEISALCRGKSSELKQAVVEFASRLGTTYQDIQSSMVTAIEESAARGAAIAANCNDVLSHLQFQDRVAQRLTSALWISDLWLGTRPIEGDPGEAIERLRVGVERQARSQENPTSGVRSNPRGFA